MQYVYVLNKHGEPLMPCSPGKARLLLKQQKAYVVRRTPFTLKKLDGTSVSKGVTFKRLRLLEPATNYLIERM